jgi:hypothetical protein
LLLLDVASLGIAHEASMSGKMASYGRREQDWAFQRKAAAGELTLLYKQLRSAEIREYIANSEHTHHLTQIKQSKDILEFLTNELNVGDSTFDPSIAMATYDAGAKLDWHTHPRGSSSADHRTRWLLSGKGKTSTSRSQMRCDQMRSGSGALARRNTGKRFAYIAVTPTQKGKTIWLAPVSDKDYNSAK